MGNTSTKKNLLYAVCTDNSDKKDNETHIYRHPEVVGQDLWALNASVFTIHDIYRTAFQDPQKQSIGRREKNEDGSLQNVVTWYANKLIKTWVEEFGSGLLNEELVPEITEWNDLTFRFLGIYSKNTLEYIISDIGACMYGITTIPIYATLGEEATEYAFDQTRMETCVVTADLVETLMKNKMNKGYFKYLKNLIITDIENFDRKLEDKYKDTFKVYSFEDVKAKGRDSMRNWAEAKPDDIYCFSYTSGTTGAPKGAMISHRNIVSLLAGSLDRLNFTPTDVHISYLPMAHVLERIFLNALLYFGVRIAVFSGDVRNLKDDLQIIKPTLFLSVPRLYNKFYDTIQGGIKKKSFIAQRLVKRATEAKLHNLKYKAEYTHSMYDKIIFNKMKSALGGNVRVMFTGSAPISVEVIDFLKIAFSAPIFEGYGQTEGCGAEFSTVAYDGQAGHIGGPFMQNEFKLVDIPEMKYTSEDRNEKGELQPRGELWVRGPNVIPGYYKLDDKNVETFTKDGWLMSGDVVMVVQPENRVMIIDRKKNIFKLSQGEYIAPDKLESVYKDAHECITEVCVYGDSLKSCLVAVINIVNHDVEKMAKQYDIQGTKDELVNNEAFKKKVIELLNKKGKEKNFNSLELIRAVIIESRDWLELDLVTTSFKLKRNEIKEYYKKPIENLYKNLE